LREREQRRGNQRKVGWEKNMKGNGKEFEWQRSQLTNKAQEKGKLNPIPKRPSYLWGDCWSNRYGEGRKEGKKPCLHGMKTQGVNQHAQREKKR